MNNKITKQILLFKEVASQLSFSKAAENMGVSKSYLSQHVKSLEKHYNSQLLYRSTRTVSLTKEGQVVLAQAAKIESLVHQTQEKIWDQQTKLKGVIKLTAPTAFAEKYLVSICNEFCALHPEIEFMFDLGNEKKTLENGDFDLAIRITNAPPTNMVAKKLTHISYWCVAAPIYLAQRGTPTAVSDLSKHNCISLSFWRKWTFFNKNNSQTIDAKGSLSFSENNLLRTAALQGIGIINVPNYIVSDDIQQGKLTQILTDYIAEPRSVYILYPQRNTQPTKLREFVQFLLHHTDFEREM